MQQPNRRSSRPESGRPGWERASRIEGSRNRMLSCWSSNLLVVFPFQARGHEVVGWVSVSWLGWPRVGVTEPTRGDGGRASGPSGWRWQRCGVDRLAARLQRLAQSRPKRFEPHQSVRGFDQHRSQSRVARTDQPGVGLYESAGGVARRHSAEPRGLFG